MSGYTDNGLPGVLVVQFSVEVQLKTGHESKGDCGGGDRGDAGYEGGNGEGGGITGDAGDEGGNDESSGITGGGDEGVCGGWKGDGDGDDLVGEKRIKTGETIITITSKTPAVRAAHPLQLRISFFSQRKVVRMLLSLEIFAYVVLFKRIQLGVNTIVCEGALICTPYPSEMRDILFITQRHQQPKNTIYLPERMVNLLDMCVCFIATCKGGLVKSTPGCDRGAVSRFASREEQHRHLNAFVVLFGRLWRSQILLKFKKPRHAGEHHRSRPQVEPSTKNEEHREARSDFDGSPPTRFRTAHAIFATQWSL